MSGFLPLLFPLKTDVVYTVSSAADALSSSSCGTGIQIVIKEAMMGVFVFPEAQAVLFKLPSPVCT